MAKVRLLNGKPLLVNGKVALNDDCCCQQTPTQICDSDCGHQIQFSVKFDQSEIDFDFSELAVFSRSAGSQRMFIEADSRGWYFTGLGLSLTIDALDVPRVANTWYLIDLCITSAAGAVTVNFCVEGTCDQDIVSDCHLASWNKLRIGDPFGDVVHRSYKEIMALSNFGAEDNFDFPTDSFDSLVGNASVITEDGITVLRIDDDDENPAYGEVVFDNPWSLNCCCGRDVTEISSISIDFTYNVFNHDTPGCDTDVTKSDSATWNRIDNDETFDGSRQFKLYISNDCEIFIEISPDTSFCTTGTFEIGYAFTDCPSGCVGAGNHAITGFLCADLSLLNAPGTPPPCASGSFTINIDSRLVANCVLCLGPGPCDDCSTVICGEDSGTRSDSFTDIAYTCSDLSSLIGSYDSSQSGTGYSLNTTITIA